MHTISNICVNHQAEPPPLDTDWSRGLFKHQGRGKTGPSRSAAEEHGNSLSCVCHHISLYFSSLFWI